MNDIDIYVVWGLCSICVIDGYFFNINVWVTEVGNFIFILFVYLFRFIILIYF